jgi:glycosyltransferase involved in cell wall biosynthesis
MKRLKKREIPETVRLYTFGETPQMKIAVLGPTYPIKGGISHYTTLLVKNLRKYHEVDFISFKYQYPSWLYPGTGQFDSSEKIITIENERIFHSLWMPSWNSVVRRILEGKSELLITAWWTFFFAFQYAHINHRIRKAGKRVMYICHNVKMHEDHPLERFFTGLAFRDVNHFIVHSSEDRDNLLRHRPDADVKINYHPTYDHFASLYNPVRAREFETKKHPNTILYFGVVRPYKGLKYLIEAFPLVLKKIPDARLLIVGDFWENVGEYENLVRELGISKLTEIVNRYVPNEEVGDYFHLADVVALPYLSATQSGIAQIAYGFGKPIIVTNVGGLPEIVDERKTGIVVPPKDSVALSEAITEILENPHKENYPNNIEQYSQRFSWENMVKTIESFT